MSRIEKIFNCTFLKKSTRIEVLVLVILIALYMLPMPLMKSCMWYLLKKRPYETLQDLNLIARVGSLGGKVAPPSVDLALERILSCDFLQLSEASHELASVLFPCAVALIKPLIMVINTPNGQSIKTEIVCRW